MVELCILPCMCIRKKDKREGERGGERGGGIEREGQEKEGEGKKKEYKSCKTGNYLSFRNTEIEDLGQFKHLGPSFIQLKPRIVNHCISNASFN